MRIEAEDLRFSYGENEVLRGVSFTADGGEIIALLGPNGVGKSTLFGCLLGFLKPDSGRITLDGRGLETLSRRELARSLAYIPQSAAPVFGYPVLDMVTMGMANRLGLLRQPGPAERERAMAALESLGIAALADRGCDRISGGERQLMLLARALVQDAHILLMDEPTANLDYGNGFRVMERIRALGKAGYTVIFSTHEPNQAFRCADRVLAMRSGTLIADGAPERVLSEQTLSALYGLSVAVRETEAGGTKQYVTIPVGYGVDQVKNDEV